MRAHFAALGGETARDVLRYAFAKGIPAGISIVAVPVYFQLLGADDYGRLSFLLALVLMLVLASTGWVNQGTLRFSKDARAELALKAQSIGYLMSAVVAVITFCSVVLAAMSQALEVLAAGILLVLVCSYQLHRIARLQANMRADKVRAMETIRSVAGFGFSVALLVLVEPTVNCVLIGMALGYALSLLVAIEKSPVNLSFREGSDGEATAAEIRRYWVYGWPLAIWFSCVSALPVIDRWLIAFWLTDEDVGRYAVLQDLCVKAFSLMFLPLTIAVYPRLLKDVREGNAVRARARAWSSIVLMAMAGVAIAAILTVSADWWGKMLAPTAIVSWQLVAILCSGGLIWQIALMAHKPLELARKTRLMASGAAVCLLVHFAICFIGLPRIGTLAAALGFSLAGMGYLLLCGNHWKKAWASV